MVIAKTILTLAVVCVLLAPPGTAQSPDGPFAAPVRLEAGGKLIGEKRLFPSPVFHDVNGDGLLDVVVGDLVGHLTVALRKPGADPSAFGAEERMKSADGRDLKFHNW